jgi:hypothetical protein
MRKRVLWYVCGLLGWWVGMRDNLCFSFAKMFFLSLTQVTQACRYIFLNIHIILSSSLCATLLITLELAAA